VGQHHPPIFVEILQKSTLATFTIKEKDLKVSVALLTDGANATLRLAITKHRMTTMVVKMPYPAQRFNPEFFTNALAIKSQGLLITITNAENKYFTTHLHNAHWLQQRQKRYDNDYW